MVEELIISSDSHVFEPPDLWTNRIDPKFRGREPRMKRVGEVDHLVIEDDQTISGIGLISNAGARFDAPETIFGPRPSSKTCLSEGTSRRSTSGT